MMIWFWVFWVVAIAASFAGAEGYALARNKPTLSRTVWIVTKAWPPLQGVAMFIAGFLFCHFWWGGAVCFAPVN